MHILLTVQNDTIPSRKSLPKKRNAKPLSCRALSKHAASSDSKRLIDVCLCLQERITAAQNISLVGQYSTD